MLLCKFVLQLVSFFLDAEELLYGEIASCQKAVSRTGSAACSIVMYAAVMRQMLAKLSNLLQCIVSSVNRTTVNSVFCIIRR